MCALTISGVRWCGVVQVVTPSYLLLCMHAVTINIEGHDQARNARQRLARGILTLQHIHIVYY